MSFLGSALGTNVNSQATGVSDQQLSGAQNNVNSATANQSALAAALAGNNGVQNQGTVFGMQGSTAAQLQNLANGNGANPALAQLNQATGQNVANQAALMAGQRGASSNVGLLARQAAQQGASTQQQAAGQAATLNSQQQLSALSQLQAQQQAMGQTAQNQVANQQAANTSYATSSTANQNNLLGMQANINDNNTKAAIAQSQNNAAMIGGVIGGVSSAAMLYKGGEVKDDGPRSNFGRMMAGGGQVPGKAEVKGNSPKNDTVPAILSPGEIVIPRSVLDAKNPGEAAKQFVEEQLKKKAEPKSHFDTGGSVANVAGVPDYASVPMNALQFPNPSPEEQMKAGIDNRLDQIKSFGQNAHDLLFGQQTNNSVQQGADQATAQQLPMAKQNQPQNFDLGGGQQPQAGLGQGLGTMPQGQNPMAGYNQMAQGYKDEAAAQGKISDAQATQYKSMADHEATLQSQMQKDSDAHTAEVQNIINDIKTQKIDSNQYINNMGTGGKIKTAIGLILGGIGGGLTHQANPALQFLNDQINRNINAQLSDQENKKTLLGALEKQYGDKQTALSTLHSVYLGQMADQINEAAAQQGSAIAAARAKQVTGPIYQQIAQYSMQSAQRQQALKSVQSGGDLAQAVPFLVAPDKQKDALDSVGKMNEINQLEDNMNQSHRHLAGETMHGALSPNDTNSALNSYSGIVQKLSEGRYNKEAADQIVTSLLPQRMDSEETMKNKAARRADFFKTFKQEPMTKLRAFGLPIPQNAAQFNKAQ